MKKWFILMLILGCATNLFAQNPDKSAFEKKFRTPAMAKFKNENSFFANPDFKWKNYFYFTFLDIGYQSAPKNLYVTDFCDFGGKYFRAKLFSAYSLDKLYLFKKEKTNIGYWFPIGVSLPVITGSNYNISLRCDYYWAIHFSDHSEYDDPENYTQKPSILDFQIQLDIYVKKAISKLNLVYGYRKQLTEWNVVESSLPIYSNNLTGPYLGISWGFGVSFKENNGLDDWKTAKKVNTITSYESFLKKYPGSHYEKEATARLEFAAYQTFEKGNINDCKYYLTRFPTGLFLKEAQDRKEELVEENAYKSAVASGTLPECDRYLSNYRNGKFTKEVEAKKTEIYAKMEETAYKNAITTGSLLECDRYLSNYRNGKYTSKIEAKKTEIYAVMKEDSIYNQTKNGGIAECENYQAIYPSGKYIQTVVAKKEKLKQEVREELNSYNNAVSSNNIDEMKHYLSAYPNGNHRAEVLKKVEPVFYNAAIKADWYTEYETYIKFCPDGSNISKVTQRLEFLRTHTAKVETDYPANVKGGQSPYSNVSSPFFQWKVTFRETGFKMGYKVEGKGWYYDNAGGAWGDNSYSGKTTEELIIKPGGAKTYDTWFSGSEFVGGYILMNFTGEDAGGHPINVQVRINCR